MFWFFILAWIHCKRRLNTSGRQTGRAASRAILRQSHAPRRAKHNSATATAKKHTIDVNNGSEGTQRRVTIMWLTKMRFGSYSRNVEYSLELWPLSHTALALAKISSKSGWVISMSPKYLAFENWFSPSYMKMGNDSNPFFDISQVSQLIFHSRSQNRLNSGINDLSIMSKRKASSFL